ncbi:hypothetical protein Anapl_16035 [Anas platyrhynchos]|uniref:Uncharacterized protein n=1 Tax=Anas platyrhynchos TaxID=8839 RepID=R0KY60_ANAPL|nr:hypothetical protein Anapl_16035 [Anas platyrhynchos]
MKKDNFKEHQGKNLKTTVSEQSSYCIGIKNCGKTGNMYQAQHNTTKSDCGILNESGNTQPIKVHKQPLKYLAYFTHKKAETMGLYNLLRSYCTLATWPHTGQYFSEVHQNKGMEWMPMQRIHFSRAVRSPVSIQSLPQENKQTNGTVIRCKEITQLSILYTGEVVAKKGEGKKTMGLDESLLNMSANKSNDPHNYDVNQFEKTKASTGQHNAIQSSKKQANKAAIRTEEGMKEWGAKWYQQQT